MVLTTSSNNKGCVIMLNRDAVFLDAESYCPTGKNRKYSAKNTKLEWGWQKSD
jgi:hypothetical protein